MSMLLEYDRSPNATLEQRMNSLTASVQRALEAVESDVISIANRMGLIGDDMESFVDLAFTEADETAPIESGQSLPELFGQIKKNERNAECETLSVGNIDMTITDEEFAELESLLPDISGGGRLIDWILPIGSVIANANPDFDPNLLYQNMTWERFAKGQTLVGVNEDDEDFSAADKTGGEKEHVLTVAEMPSHEGHLYSNSDMNWSGNAARYLRQSDLTAYGSVGRGWNIVNGGEAQPAGVSRGSGSAHNNMPPYVTVYYWRRTA